LGIFIQNVLVENLPVPLNQRNERFAAFETLGHYIHGQQIIEQSAEFRCLDNDDVLRPTAFTLPGSFAKLYDLLLEPSVIETIRAT
jgi:hypothetical protein